MKILDDGRVYLYRNTPPSYADTEHDFLWQRAPEVILGIPFYLVTCPVCGEPRRVMLREVEFPNDDMELEWNDLVRVIKVYGFSGELVHATQAGGLLSITVEQSPYGSYTSGKPILSHQCGRYNETWHHYFFRGGSVTDRLREIFHGETPAAMLPSGWRFDKPLVFHERLFGIEPTEGQYKFLAGKITTGQEPLIRVSFERYTTNDMLLAVNMAALDVEEAMRPVLFDKLFKEVSDE